MERQRKTRARQMHRLSAPKRLVSFLLAAAMVFTNVSADLSSVQAAQGERVDFEVYGSDLVKAIDDAVMNGTEVTADDLDFTNGKNIDKFENLFFGDGRVYEVWPEIEGATMETDLRVFVRLPEDANDMYMVTGDEEIIFLYVNSGEDTVSCSTSILRMEDGEEKVKRTKRITVKAFEDAFGDEEIEIISKPAETVPAETEPVKGPASETEASVPAEGVEETTAVPEESAEAPEEGTEETTDAAGETTEPEVPAEGTEESAEAGAEETGEAEEPAETAEKTEGEKSEEPEEASEETEEKAEEAAEEADNEEKTQEDDAVASISRHFAPVVAERDEEAVEEAEAEIREEEPEE
ncbi:MAG: doubled motif LPXTG anchor domain-containing protein, partial [Enterocloster sp.]